METGIVKLNPELMALLSKEGGSDIIPFKQEIFVLNDYVAGTGYCDKIGEVIGFIDSGTSLTLRRHPDNEVDEYAIGIYFKEIRIGWVPMKDNLVIARLMDAGKMFTCKIVHIEPDDNWPRIDVNIFMVD